MKRSIKVCSAITFSLVTLMVQGQQPSATTCSAVTLKGQYGFSAVGLFPQRDSSNQKVIMYRPVSEVGVLAYDGLQNVQFTAILSFDGDKPTKTTATGTYAFDSGCTGHIDLKDGQGKFYARLEFVVNDEGHSIHTLFARPQFSMAFEQSR